MAAILNSANAGFIHFAQKKLTLFILNQPDDGSHLEPCHVGFRHCHLGFRHLDSDTLLTSLRFTQKHSLSNLTLTQINSIWLKLIHSHLTWWWQPSWILPTWIPHLGFSHLNYSSQTHSHLPRLVPTIFRKKTHSFILTQLDDGSHLEFCHVEFRHMAYWIQTLCYLLSDSINLLSLHPDSESN